MTLSPAPRAELSADRKYLTSATTHTAGITDRFDQAVRGAPDQLAVIGADRSLTYRQLSNAARALAVRLHQELEVQPGDVVVAHLDPGIGAIVVLLAILHAGACYVPVASDTPLSRIDMILDDAEPKAVVSVGAEMVTAATHPQCLVLDDSTWDQAPLNEADSHIAVGGDALCYMVYTSGTTGRPKGVPVSHANVHALIDAAEEVFALRREDRWLQFHTLAFDFSVWEIWGCLLTGGTVVVADTRSRLVPELTADLIERERVSILSQTPTAFAMLSRHLVARTVPALRYVVFGGEALPSSVIRPWANANGLDTPALINMYGITECTVHLTFHRVTASDLDMPAVPIGKPLPGFEATLVDGTGRTGVSQGVLHVRGPQVVQGYRNRPQETMQRFRVAVPGNQHDYFCTGDLCGMTSGVLQYIARVDQQVQVNGFRVEIDEVLSAAFSIPFVCQCKVLPIPQPDGFGTALALIYTTVDGRPRHIREVRHHLMQTLPRYMLPHTIAHRSEMPITANGKLDESTLQKEITRSEHQ